ncbi:MAG: hypothetical protein IT438_01210 [Phycisphaerales bacterium]|nr:hypothetical protein [Phycisphaerales bacterium]
MRFLIPIGLVAAAVSPAPAQTRITRYIRDDVFYQIMPIAWRDSDNDSTSGQNTRFGDFNGLAAGLPYLQQLGVTAVWLNPIHPSPAYHGYQHGPIDQVNSRFGTEAQFLSFVNTAHATGGNGAGIKVFLDAVCYGISQNSAYAPYYTSAFNNPSSTYDTWLAFTNPANTSFTGYSFNTWNGASVGFINWDLRTPAARNTVINWCRKWLDPNADGDPIDGIDGYRLDHVWVQYNQGPDGWGYNLDDFWTPWKQGLQAVRPDVFTFVEQADWGSQGNEFLPPHDAAFTKPFEFAARDAIRTNTAASLYSAMAGAVSSVPSGKSYLAIIGDHDVDRLSSNVQSTASSLNRREKIAAAVLLTQPFPPIIYYGDEIGMRGTKQSYGSDADDIPMREPFKWNAVAGAPMSNYHILNSQAYTNRVSRDNDGRSVQEQQGVASSLLETYRTLIATRRNSVALRRGTYSPVTTPSTRVWSFVRHHEVQTVLVAINLHSSSVATTLNLSSFAITGTGGSTTPVNIQPGGGPALASITAANKAAYPITLPAYSWAIAQVELTPPPPPPPSPADIDGANIPTDAASPALATQAVGTSFGDNASELNQLYIRAQDNGLRIGLTGNLATDGTALALLIDSSGAIAAGQSVLNTTGLGPPPGGIVELSGLTLDAGFTPEHLFFINCASGSIFVDQAALPASGSPSKTYRGRGSQNNASGTLSGGTNPNNLYVAMDNRNSSGVTGSSAANAAAATTGFEMLIPWTDIGQPATRGARACAPIRVCALIAGTDGTVSNQLLPPAPASQTANLGLTPNFAALAGSQFVSITLPPAADFNNSGTLSVQDLFDFLSAYFAGDLAADINTSGGLSVQDVFDFLAAYFGGCD